MNYNNKTRQGKEKHKGNESFGTLRVIKTVLVFFKNEYNDLPETKINNNTNTK